jgi:hypothetical protein
MKDQIDSMVRNIHANLNRGHRADGQVESALAPLGLNGFSVARDSRDALIRLAEQLSGDDHVYALQQLDLLPKF